MRSLLSLMEAFKRPWLLSRIPTGACAHRVWELADKYDIVDLIRHTCLLIIFKNGQSGYEDQLEDEDSHFDYFVWAVTSKDMYLLGHVIRHWPVGDPVDWTRERIDIIGWELWHFLVRSFPRAQPGRDRDHWNTVMKSPGIEDLIRTGAVRLKWHPSIAMRHLTHGLCCSLIALLGHKTLIKA